MSSFSDNHGIYADVASGFQVPGFDLNKSTMFRLSLRQSPSDICMKTYSGGEISELMQNFAQSDDEFLAFLNNVTFYLFYLNVELLKHIIRGIYFNYRLVKFLSMNIRAVS